MKMQKPLNKIPLFYPGYLTNKSDTFEIPFGGQWTIVTLGLVDNDYIEFEMVNVPAAESNCMLMPELSVTGTQILRFNGKNVRLTADNPVAVLNAPQGFILRAVRHVEEELNVANLYVWAIETSTPVAKHLNGFENTNMEIMTVDFTDIDPYN